MVHIHVLEQYLCAMILSDSIQKGLVIEIKIKLCCLLAKLPSEVARYGVIAELVLAFQTMLQISSLVMLRHTTGWLRGELRRYECDHSV